MVVQSIRITLHTVRRVRTLEVFERVSSSFHRVANDATWENLNQRHRYKLAYTFLATTVVAVLQMARTRIQKYGWHWVLTTPRTILSGPRGHHADQLASKLGRLGVSRKYPNSLAVEISNR